MKKGVLILVVVLLSIAGFAQNAILQGVVINPVNNEPVSFANVIIYQTNTGVVTNINGEFVFENLASGYIRLQVSLVGFQTTVTAPILVTNAKKAFISIELVESTTNLDEVTIKASPFKRSQESPLSMQTIGIAEIEKNPGGNRDISKVIQSLPGVGGASAYRNDVIVRGGGPSENRFYLDDVEIPNLNHFATQGASGGPIGIINVDFIRSVDFYSGAFPADKGNALSSVLSFKQVDGNREKMKYRFTIGASDLALTLDGPLGQKTSMVFSARRSYLQFLFSALDLSFLPIYNDAQFKIKTRFDEKNELTLIGLGAIDQFKLNLDANKTEEQRYILGYLPVYEQWNYTVGGVYKHYRENGYHTLVISRNHLNNSAYKYTDNIEVDSLKIYDYLSNEIETKLRYENNIKTNNALRINYGSDLQYVNYDNNTSQVRYVDNSATHIDYSSEFDMVKWSLFGQLSQGLFKQRIIASFGLRADANNYSSQMNNLFDQLSPRLSLSIPVGEKWSVNTNVGRYYQLPAYTTLGYKNTSGDFINKTNGITYIQADHLVGGAEYRPNEDSKITLEGFYKQYHHYPFSVSDSVALASKGGDYGTVGDEEVYSTGVGRAYGAEFFVRHTNILGANVLLSYTFVRSEFQNIDGKYLSSAWDNKHLLNIVVSRSFKRNWDFGFKYRFAGGAPYTPDDVEKSSYVLAWDAQYKAYPDYSRYNQERLSSSGQLDIRIDKSYYFKHWSLMLYLDIQNVLNAKVDTPDILTVATDENGNKIIKNPDAPVEEQKYEMRYIVTNGSGTVLPSIGIMIEF